ncbi:Aspartate carbamoyltransferase regulatory chain (PyrI) [Lachnospiraceae bacterium TWA4]|nr:Aspartate carbamoyltransferase regulatory chain (PyrI) [Lachnospiraceae bacterium TWA4]
MDVLGFIDPGITVNIVKDGSIVEKKKLQLPNKLTNIVRCKNPRCITSIEQELPQVFFLADPREKIYRCQYCEEKYDGKRQKHHH